MSEDARFQVILIDKITDPELPLRQDLTPESVEELSKSIATMGLIEPLVVKKTGGIFEVIAGHRRLLASQLADLVEVPCYVLDVSEEKADMIKLHENLHRKDISPIEEGRYFRYLKEHYGWDPGQIAGMIHKSEAYVFARMAIDEYPDDILESLEAGQINIAVARELAQVDDDDQRGQYLDYAVRNGITSTVAEQWKQQYKAQKLANPARGTVTPELPITPPESVVTIECFLCGDQVPMREAKIVYTHAECLSKFQHPV